MMSTGESAVHDFAARQLNRGLAADPGLRAQAEAIYESGFGDIDPSFPGFVGQYYLLSKLIPKDRVVYDMGCSYGLQAWFFRDHCKYIGVDLPNDAVRRLRMPNAEYHEMSIGDFLATATIDPKHFAICNYVPPWEDDNERLVAEAFRHMFIFYPMGDPWSPFVEIEMAKPTKENA